MAILEGMGSTGTGDFDRSQTTTAIYRVDVARLKQRQLQVSAAQNERITLPDLLHVIIASYFEQESGKTP